MVEKGYCAASLAIFSESAQIEIVHLTSQLSLHISGKHDHLEGQMTAYFYTISKTQAARNMYFQYTINRGTS